MSLNQKEMVEYEFPDYEPWDPIGEFDRKKCVKNTLNVLKLYNIQKKGFGSLFLYFLKKFFLVLILMVVFLVFFGVSPSFFVVLLFVLGFFGWFYFRELLNDVVFLFVAKKNRFFYNPLKDNWRFKRLAEFFPELFKKRFFSRSYVENEFWGKRVIDGKEVNFYGGVYAREENVHCVQHDSRPRKKIVRNCFFMFRLEKPLSFKVFLDGGFRSMFFRSKNSSFVDFSQAFPTIYLDGKKDATDARLYEVLSPAVQMKLVNLHKKYGRVSVLFSKNVMFFMFEDFSFTKFASSSESIDDKCRDVDEKINDLLRICSEISKYLD